MTILINLMAVIINTVVAIINANRYVDSRKKIYAIYAIIFALVTIRSLLLLKGIIAPVSLI
jgi:hypothetical protein